MPLTLVVGPANAAKAGEVLGAFAAATPRGALLVVPTAPDVTHYTEELGRDGALLGAVLTPEGLFDEIACRTGASRAALGEHGRTWVLARAVRSTRLERLADAAGSSGFREATGALTAELARSLVSSARFAAALRTWAAGDPDRRALAREIGALVLAYERELAATERLDPERLAWSALDALRADPARWGSAPVFLYGFDDLDGLQRDAVETLAGACGADVTVSLTYEPGRMALAARAEAVEALRQLADLVVEMPALDTYYAPAARPALHHLERSLFEAGAGRVAAADAVALFEAGGERAEAELLAGEVARLIAGGMPAEEIAVVVRSPDADAAAIVRMLELYGIPYARERRLPLAHTGLGGRLLALARCAWGQERRVAVADLLAVARTPGVLPGGAGDAIEATLARVGAATLARARVALRRDPAVGDAASPVLARILALREAERPAEAVAHAARELFAAGGRGRAPVLSGPGHEDAAALAAALAALAELEELDPHLEGVAVLEALDRVRVPAGMPVRPGAVLVCDPLRIRARRFRAVLVGGLVEGRFPRAGAPEPFLSDEMRRELAQQTGLLLRLREDTLARERYLLYACVSRATERLVLSYRSSDEEGNLMLPSPFLRDIADRLEEGWWARRERRLLSDVVWDPDRAPTARERVRAMAAERGEKASASTAAERPVKRLSAAALAHVRHARTVSANALETFAACPVKWLVGRQLAPQRLEPEAEPLARGSYMHDALERVLRELGEAVTEATLPRALVILDRVLGELPEAIAAGEMPGVRAGARRLIEADLRRYLEHEARTGIGWRPAHLEQSFGDAPRPGQGTPLPPLVLGAGEDAVEVRGVIDRIDVAPDGRRAVVRDYKSGRTADHQGAKWAQEHRLQVPLYMLVARELLGLEPVGGFYQPLRGDDLRARGAYLAGLEGGGLVPTDLRASEELAGLLADAREEAIALAGRLRAGEIVPAPDTCSRDGCLFPGICRSA